MPHRDPQNTIRVQRWYYERHAQEIKVKNKARYEARKVQPAPPSVNVIDVFRLAAAKQNSKQSGV